MQQHLFAQKFSGKLQSQAQEATNFTAVLGIHATCKRTSSRIHRAKGTRDSVAQHLNDLQQSDHNELSLLSHGEGHLRRGPGSKNAILLTWQITFNYL